MTTEPRLVLASASPRRRELLSQIGVGHRVVPTAIDESPHVGETPSDYVLRLALEKARAARVEADLPVLGADTTVVLDGRMLGKPTDVREAEHMLAQLSGRTHEVLTAVALVRGMREATALSRSHVTFRETEPHERAAYVAGGEPLDKAGAYAIQGLGAVFVARLDGSYSGVMGLPLYETAHLLADFGIRIPAELEEPVSGVA